MERYLKPIGYPVSHCFGHSFYQTVKILWNHHYYSSCQRVIFSPTPSIHVLVGTLRKCFSVSIYFFVLLYSLGCNPLLSFFISVCKLSFGHGEPLRAGSVSFRHVPVILGFTSLLSVPAGSSGLGSSCPCPTSDRGHLSTVPGSCCWRTAFTLASGEKTTRLFTPPRLSRGRREVILLWGFHACFTNYRWCWISFVCLKTILISL